jgi:hypothetical protein
VREPLVPEVGGAHERLVRRVVGLGTGAVAVPAQGDVRHVAVVHRRAGPRPRALEADAQVRGERELEVGPLRARDGLVVPGARVLPVHARAPVVQHGLAFHVHLDRAVDAADHPQQHVVGVVVGGRAAVGGRAVVLVVPRADEQDVAHDDPARPRAPRRLDDHGARQVAPARRHRRVGRRQAERAGRAVQHRAEHGGPVHARQAHPLHVAVRRHERGHLAVRQEGVVGDGRERRAAQRHVGGCLADHATSPCAHSRAGL